MRVVAGGDLANQPVRASVRFGTLIALLARHLLMM